MDNLKKIIFLFLLFSIIITSELNSQTILFNKKHYGYYLIRLYYNNHFNFDSAAAMSIVSEVCIRNSDWLDCILNEHEFNQVRIKKIKYEILNDDLESYYESILTKSGKEVPKVLAGTDFTYGSMGGYYTLEEAYKVFADMHSKFPQFVSDSQIIGHSIEGRPILAYCFGDSDSQEQVLFTALHHAREPGGLTTLVYFLWNLLENADSGNPEALFLLHNRAVYVIPVINPDGYFYNEETMPGGGGMWRKNRRINSDSSFGVDLNRNYGPMESWDSPASGSSNDPSSENYRGTAPFSEPETQAVRDFCVNHHIKTALNYHTFGGSLIYPWAYVNSETPDSVLYRAFSEDVTKNNHYCFGRDFQTILYRTSGASDDWMYLASPEKQKIISMTSEAGTVLDGFWPPMDRIIPIAQNNLYTNYQVLWSGGVNLRPISISFNYDSTSGKGYVSLTIQNIGVENSDNPCFLKLSSLNDSIMVDSYQRPIIPLKPGDKITEFFHISQADNFINGSMMPFRVEIIQDSIPRLDTFQLQLYNYSTQVLYSDRQSLVNWMLNNWGTEYDSVLNKDVLSDSPGGNYDDMKDNYLTYGVPIRINADNETLEFKAHWYIEPGNDVAVVQVSSNNGSSWENLSTSRMNEGLGAEGSRQEKGKYGFDGFFPDWVEQDASLSQYINKNILLRFGMLSNSYFNFDGIHLDDIKIRNYSIPYSDKQVFISISPNPVYEGLPITIGFITNSGNSSNVYNIDIYNLTGVRVKHYLFHSEFDGKHQFIIPTIGLASDCYFIEIKNANSIQFAKFMLIP